MKKYQKAGLIGRFKPLHNGSANMLEKVCESCEETIIGIGSINKHDYRNPFTAEETKEMINLYMADKPYKYQIKFIKDHGHEIDGRQAWKQELKENMGDIEVFFSGNPYVKDILKNSYEIIDAKKYSQNEDSPIKASMVRLEMAMEGDWEQYTPREVMNYIKEKALDERLRREFGDEIIKKESRHAIYNNETLEEEIANVTQ